MPRKKISEIEMQAVAYLYSENYSRDEIRYVLKLSQPSVSRSIQHAMQKGWLKSTVRFVTENIPAARMQEIDALVSPQRQLTERFKEFTRKHGGATVPDIRVLPSANRSTDAALWQERLEQFGNIAAAHIRELLLPAKKCGVSWGYTITSIARGLRKLGPSPLRKGEPIQFIALCGEPLTKPRGKATTQISSSSLAEQFDEIINGSTEHSYTLSSVPAIILEDDDEKAGTIRDFFKHFATEYRQILYGDNENEPQKKPLLDELDTILTGVGAPTHPHGYWGDALIVTERIDWEWLKSLIIGDIGGVLLPRPGLGIKENAELTKLSDRWMGIEERHMKQCARKASQNGTAGVIVVAIGANKAASVYESVRLRLVNTLIIDRDLAEALLQES